MRTVLSTRSSAPARSPLGDIQWESLPVPRVRLSGEIEYYHQTPLLEALTSAASQGSGDLRLDLSGLRYMDSGGLSALIIFHQQMKRQGRSIILESPRPSLLRILNIAGITRLFSISSTGSSSDLPQGAPGPGWQRLSFSLPCRPQLLALARDRILTLARSLPFTREERYDLELGMGEALSNAMRHGGRLSEKSIQVEGVINGNALVLTITDPGQGFDPEAIPIPDVTLLKEGGMGLHFMKHTLDDVKFIFDERGTTVRLVKRAKEAAPDREIGS